MKNFRKSMRRFIPAIIFSVIFTLLFPYSLMAEESEYKIPEQSLSYLAQAQTSSQASTGGASEQATNISNTDRQEFEPEFQPQAPVSEKIQVIPEPAMTPAGTEKHDKPTTAAAAIEKMNKEKAPAKPSVQARETKTPAPSQEIKTPAAASEVKVPAAPDESSLTSAAEQQYETPVFAEALSKMQQNKAQREAEAARLGIVLPSQGGDMAAVSPSLSKIQQTLKAIMAR